MSSIMTRLKATIADLAHSIKKQASFSYYAVMIPSQLVLDDLINQISAIDAALFPGLEKNKALMIDTLERIKLYFHYNAEQHQESYTSKQRSKIKIKKLSLFRKILINLITFYERCVALGPVTVVSELFKTAAAPSAPNPVITPEQKPTLDPSPDPDPVPNIPSVTAPEQRATVPAQCVSKVCSSAYQQSKCKEAETVACSRRTCRAVA
jgi:hypothetical protein